MVTHSGIHAEESTNRLWIDSILMWIILSLTSSSWSKPLVLAPYLKLSSVAPSDNSKFGFTVSIYPPSTSDP
jgi:hypothetical protein